MAWTSSAEVARPDPHQKKSILVSPAKHPLLLRKQRVFFEFRPHFRRPHGVNPKVHTPLAHARIRARQSDFRFSPSPFTDSRRFALLQAFRGEGSGELVCGRGLHPRVKHSDQKSSHLSHYQSATYGIGVKE